MLKWRGGGGAAAAAARLISRSAPCRHPSHLLTHRSIHHLYHSKSAVAGSGVDRRHFAVADQTVGSLSSVVSCNAHDVSVAIQRYARCYWELSKARLSALVVATSGAGFVLGSNNSVDIMGLCFTCAGTMMVAASASSLNQLFEVQNDARMKRTSKRPLPSGRISKAHAAIWASSVGFTGITLLALKANYLAAGLAASNLIMYSFIYTPLKQIHPANTWVGAIVGAIPPLLGWAAASGEITLNAMILPATLYFWQLPHFMALAYLCRSDYIAGGFQMFSLADASGQRTALVSLRNCLYLIPLGFLSYDWGITSGWFFLESTFLTLCLSARAVLFVRERTAKNARRMFRSSLLYLPLFMSAMLLHRLPENEQEFLLNNVDKVDEFLCSEVLVQEESREQQQRRQKRNYDCKNANAQPPISYASVAPIPFLPVPLYGSQDT